MRTVASGHSVHLIVELSLDLTCIFMHNELREHIALRLLQCRCGNHGGFILCAEAVDKGVGRRNFDGLSQVIRLQVKINHPDIKFTFHLVARPPASPSSHFI